MSKKNKKQREPVAGQLLDLSDDILPIIGFVRTLGRASQVDIHCTNDDSGQWVAAEIEDRLRKIDRKLERMRRQLNKGRGAA